jgi:hypothetical protein
VNAVSTCPPSNCGHVCCSWIIIKLRKKRKKCLSLSLISLYNCYQLA